jgi:hypothetical protein
MSRRLAALALLLVPALPGCTENTAIGNDREAQRNPPATAAPFAEPAAALGGVASVLVTPQVMSPADLRALPPGGRRCRFRMTRVGFPTFVWPLEGSGRSFLKFNDRLVPLPRTDGRRFSAAGISVDVRPRNGAEPGPDLFEAEMILRLPEIPHERGYHGYAECAPETADAS